MPRPPTLLEWLIPTLLVSAVAVAGAYMVASWVTSPGSWSSVEHSKLVVGVVAVVGIAVRALQYVAHRNAVRRFSAGHLEADFERYLRDQAEKDSGSDPDPGPG